ncbi:ATP-dependent DNA helicase PIF1-like [Thraustotheca clavata]|uniref:ATP-dependent DNA helicase n=1 Tax=Thraustotheca clavata TaxID=74557 RepID=A0A1V9ZXF1_9STRA|nr:ATP-dependent DNA helicase PIF1-like [Thraustotheca clavata]
MEDECLCDVEVQVASSSTGQRRSSKVVRRVVLLKRAGGIQVCGPGYKAGIRTPGAEVYFSQIHNGKLTLIKRGLDTLTQYNFHNGQMKQLIKIRDFAFKQGAVSKTPVEMQKQIKSVSTPPRKALSDRTNNLLHTPSPSPLKNKKRKAASPHKARALHGSNTSKRTSAQFTHEQKEVIEAVAKRENVFFTGRAGTGKSFLLKQLQRRLPKDGLFSTATTGIAAYQIHGMTLHHFAGLTAASNFKLQEVIAAIERKKDALLRWQLAKVLIIDEISMLDGRVFDLLEGVARKIRKTTAYFGGIQLILSGDFCQLPPVSEDKQAIFCFEAKCWDDVIKTKFSLTQVFRQKDEEFIEILNAIREGNQTQTMLSKLNKQVIQVNDDATQAAELDSIHIFTHNIDVLQMNQKHLHALSGVAHEYTAKDRGARDYLTGFPVPSRVILKKDAKVMLTKTLSVTNGLVNGSRGIVLGFTPDAKLPIVRFTNGISQVIGLEEFNVMANDTIMASRHQIPLTLAYGISIHKSQGLTFDRATLHLSKVFEYGQAYVALSRLSLTKDTIDYMSSQEDDREESDVGFQAYREKYNETIATPNGPLLRVIQPPMDGVLESKRTELIENAEENLDQDMDELKDATHLRNVEIQRQFDAILTRGHQFEVKLAEEGRQRDESIAQLRDKFSSAFDQAYQAMETKTKAAFDQSLNGNIVEKEEWQNNVQVLFNEFIQVTVPNIIEALQGTITRRLEKSHETFDIDNTKLLKREKKMTNQVETHERKTAQAFVDEKDRRVSTFIALQEAIHATMRSDDRQTERKQNSHIQTIVALYNQYLEEKEMREAEDAELLEKVSSAMERLHSSILDTFGEEK